MKGLLPQNKDYLTYQVEIFNLILVSMMQSGLFDHSWFLRGSHLDCPYQPNIGVICNARRVPIL